MKNVILKFQNFDMPILCQLYSISYAISESLRLYLIKFNLHCILLKLKCYLALIYRILTMYKYLCRYSDK